MKHVTFQDRRGNKTTTWTLLLKILTVSKPNANIWLYTAKSFTYLQYSFVEPVFLCILRLSALELNLKQNEVDKRNA